MYSNRLALKRKLPREDDDVEEGISKMSIKMSSKHSISLKMSISTEHRSEHHHKTALRRLPNGMKPKANSQSKPAEVQAIYQLKEEIRTMETKTSSVHIHSSNAVQIQATSKAYEKKTQTSYQEMVYRKMTNDVKAHSSILEKISRSKQIVKKSPAREEPDKFAECEINSQATTARVVERSSFMTKKAGSTPSVLISQRLMTAVQANGDDSTFETAETTLVQSSETHAAEEADNKAAKLALLNLKWNRHNPDEIDDYATDIFEHLKSREGLFHIKPYMHRQPHVTSTDRALVIDWLVDVQRYLKLTHETLYMSTKLMDMFLSRKIVHKDMLQLVGAAAMLLASKYDVSISFFKLEKNISLLFYNCFNHKLL